MQNTTNESLYFAPFSFGSNGKRKEVRRIAVIYELCFEMSLCRSECRKLLHFSI